MQNAPRIRRACSRRLPKRRDDRSQPLSRWARQVGDDRLPPSSLDRQVSRLPPSSSPTITNELAESAEQIYWPHSPELKEFEQIAGAIISAGYYNSEELADASSAERTQLYKILSEGRAGWARLLRKISGAKSPPAEAEAGKSLPYKKVNVSAAILAYPALSGIGELPGPRQEAANMFSEALRGGSRATPSCAPYLAPKLGDLHGPSRIQLAGELSKLKKTGRSGLL